MSGFNFGTPNTGQPAAPTFGATNTGFSLGASPAPASNLSFGTPKPGGFNFGAPGAAAATAPVGFGQPSATPQASSGFNFGAPTATVQPQQQTPAPSFGAPQQQQQQPAFGAQNPPLPTFGTPQQQQQQPPAFGAQQSTFGTPQASLPTNTVQPLSVSTQPNLAAQPQATGGFSFGAPAATTTATLGFPTPTAAPQAQPANTGFGFGAASTTATATVAPLSFGLSTPASSAAPTLTLNPLTTSTPATGLSFGQPTTQTSTFFGVQPAQQTTGLLGSLNATAAPAVTSSAAPPSFGLGGIDMNKTQPKAVEGKHESTKVKETQVPKEIIQTVDEFKAYVKQQKTLSSDIIRTTDRKLKSVTEEIQRLNCSVQETSNDVDNNKLSIKLLRSDTSKVIQHADMVQRTHETPSGLQFENVMPQIYFNELIHKYENDMLTLKHQVELTEKHLQSLANPQNFSAQDLKRGLHQIHESFIALAGRLQETHMKVEGQKEQYLNLRKFMLRDSTDVFEVEQDKQMSGNASKVQFGPNPFTNSVLGGGMNISNQSMAKQQWPANQTQQQMPPSNNTFFGVSSLGNNSFGFRK